MHDQARDVTVIEGEDEGLFIDEEKSEAMENILDRLTNQKWREEGQKIPMEEATPVENKTERSLENPETFLKAMKERTAKEWKKACEEELKLIKE